MSDVIGLLCIAGLVLVLGGGVLVMLYGVRGLVAMARDWIDRK